jgi:hypothetical protein
MLLNSRVWMAAAVAIALGAAPALADLTSSLKKGTPDLKSAGPLAFGPEGILFAGDPQGGAVFALDTGDRTPSAGGAINVPGIDGKVAALLGTDAKGVQIVDLAVNPISKNAYLSVARGQGAQATPVLLKVDQSGKLSEVSLKDIPFSKASIASVPADGPANPRTGLTQRMQAITDLAYVDGSVIVAGLSNEEFASTLRSLPFPFKEGGALTSVEIYHGAHGKFETNAPVRTFAVYEIAKTPHVLAAYTCTPLVKFPLSDLKPGAKVRGTTVAELGNGNRPLDMVIYQKNGKDYILSSNTKHGVIKITTENIGGIEGITAKVSGTAGLKYEKIEDFKGVTQLDKLDNDHALLLVSNADTGASSLQTVALP